MEREKIITVEGIRRSVAERGGADKFQDHGEYEIFDSTEGYTEEELQKIRDKTFTRELRDLVDKVTDQEDMEITPDEERITENNLLHLYHSLFYKAVSLIGMENSNSSFNPLDYPQDTLYDSLLTSIEEGMADMQMEDFAVLSYDFEKRCYSPWINQIKDLDGSNLMIDLSEALFKKIFNGAWGVLLTYEEIKESLFLYKRFPLSEREKVYFFALRNLWSKFSSLYPEIMSHPGELSTIVMIKTNSPFLNTEEEIHNRIVDHLMVHYLLFDRIISGNLTISADNLKRAYSLIEYYYNLYRCREGGQIFLLRCVYRGSISAYYLFRLLQAKIRGLLYKETVASYIKLDMIIVFTNRDEGERLSEIIEEMNRLHDNLIQKEILEIDDRSSFNHLLLESLIK